MDTTLLETNDQANAAAAANNAASAAQAKKPFEPSLDPLIPTEDYLHNPYKIYKELRENAPIYRSPWGVWIASRYEEVASILKDKNFGRGYFYFEGLAERHGKEILEEPIYQTLRNTMTMKDGAEHSRIRKLVASAFTLKRSEALRPSVQKHVDAMLDKVAQQGEFDLLQDLAYPLPSEVTCDLLGIPQEGRSSYAERSTNGSRVLEPVALSGEELAEQNGAIAKFDSIFREMYEQRLTEPTDDLTTALIQARVDGDKLTYEEIRDNVLMFFVAGGETTVNTIGNGFLALFQNPDQFALLRKNPDLLNSAVEEFIRYDGSVQITPRQALEDTEICGQLIKAGDTVLCFVASANHDPAIYTHPEKLDITRTDIKPVTFGGGPHFCIAAQLSRIEAQVAIGSTLKRFPHLRLKNPDVIERLSDTVVFRGLQSLPVLT